MITFKQLTLAALFFGLLVAQVPVYAVDYYQQQLNNEQLLKRQVALQKKMERARYLRQVGDKALNGAANIVSSPLEVPKNVINIYNEPDSNLVYGLVGGLIKGTFDAASRIGSGVSDLVTAPLPTKPTITPKYIWDDFDKSNSYGPIFRLVENPKIEPYIAPEPRPVVKPTPIEDHTEDYTKQTNQQLDTLFREKMMK